jgi:hypothetical protein
MEKLWQPVNRGITHDHPCIAIYANVHQDAEYFTPDSTRDF